MTRVKLDGVSAGILNDNDDSITKLNIGGWSTAYKHLKSGDKVIVESSSGQTTRYKVDEIKYMDNVKDQYFMYLTFNPRKGRLKL